MKKYKGRNIVSIISSVILGLAGLAVIVLTGSKIANIIGIALVILAIIGFANYYKYSVVLDSSELRITAVFKNRRIRYKDILKIFTVQEGKIKVTYIVDKYEENGKWYIRGTYPPQPVERLKSVQFDALTDVMSINSYSFFKYKELLTELVRKVGLNSDVDTETWHIVNS